MTVKCKDTLGLPQPIHREDGPWVLGASFKAQRRWPLGPRHGVQSTEKMALGS